MIKARYDFRRGLASPNRSSLANGLLLAALMGSATLASLGGCSSEVEPEEDIDTEVENLANEEEELAMEPAPTPPAEPVPPPPFAAVSGGPTANGLEIPEDYQDWRVIGVADRTDNGSIRVLVGNDIAVDAARSGDTNPWPDGSMIAHYVWADGANEDARLTIAPGDFTNLTLMVKDSAAYAEDGGWAYGAWAGPDLMPSTNAQFDRACVDCHTSRVADRDFVFTDPGIFPTDEEMAAAAPTLTGLALPADIRDWRVIGVANRNDNNTIRVIVGNDIAVDAARSGSINPWPTGSMLAHYVWAKDVNPVAPEMVAPGAFGGFTLMVKRGAALPVDGGWQYGNWGTSALVPSTDAQFDRDCVSCHTGLVGDQDFVFTRPGALPSLD
jgi:mono/diheme cytochrome c family protein